jgi:hypothetical protein
MRFLFGAKREKNVEGEKEKANSDHQIKLTSQLAQSN